MSNTPTAYLNEIKQILHSARQQAYIAVNSAMVEAYWKMTMWCWIRIKLK